MGLAARLREETSQAHEEAESGNYVRAVFRGVVDRDTYCQQLADFLLLYRGLEAALDKQRNHPAIEPLLHPALPRVASIEADLKGLGASHREGGKSAQHYEKRMAQLAAEAPWRLAAHAYVRYMGDLSGGQALKKLLARALELQDGPGLSFYDFPELADLKVFKNEYRSAIDNLPLSPKEQDEVVEEAKLAFQMNGAIFAELEAMLVERMGADALSAALNSARSA